MTKYKIEAFLSPSQPYLGTVRAKFDAYISAYVECRNEFSDMNF
jgi:hypothetical protein